MRIYHVQVFIPTVVEIEAESEAEALEKVGALYREHYAKDFLTWIEPMPQPEEVT